LTYIATYVDDLTIASKNPQAIIDALEAKPNNFKLKGTGEIDVLLGCNYFCDRWATLLFPQELSKEDEGPITTLWNEPQI